MGLWDGGFGTVEVRRVQPYEATKAYVCPGCHRQIAAGHRPLRRRAGRCTRPAPALAQGLLGSPSEGSFVDLDVHAGDRGHVESDRAVPIVSRKPFRRPAAANDVAWPSPTAASGCAEAIEARVLISQNTTIDAAAGDEIDLAVGRSPIAIDDLVTVWRCTTGRPDLRPTYPAPDWRATAATARSTAALRR